MLEAAYYQRKKDGAVECQLCPQQCLIKPGKRGKCGVRLNQEGTLYTTNYGKLTSLAEDPIEKKPLYHFYPGSTILSLGTFGCNFNCQFCQNYEISQGKPPYREFTPAEVVEAALERQSPGIAYTYSEPVVWFEFVLETSRLAREKGLKNVFISNGFIKEEPLQELLPYLDAVNLDLKAFSDDYYRQVCAGRLQPVLDNIQLLFKAEQLHLELTTLIVPGLNDSKEELRELFQWIKALSPAIPLHLTRYFPRYKLNKPLTPIEKLKEAYQMARDYLDYVYLGNTLLKGSSTTYCPACAYAVIERRAYQLKNKLNVNRCPQCGELIAGVFV